MEGLQWLLQKGEETLLLVAVERRGEEGTGVWPCRVLGEFSSFFHQAPPASADAGARISRLLSDVGVPTNLLGYAYLRTALSLLAAEPELG